MDNFNKPLHLRPDTIRALQEIEAGAPNPLHDASADAAERLVRNLIKPMLWGAGMSNFEAMTYGWFLREVSRLWRSKTGRELAFYLELCIRKWTSLGLNPSIAQFLITELHERLKSATASRLAASDPSSATRSPDHQITRSPSPSSSATRSPDHQITTSPSPSSSATRSPDHQVTRSPSL